MLLEFSCTNHKSIKDKIVFSMLASKDNSHQEELNEFNGLRVIRNAAIYGANGSGKSSFIGAIEYLKNLVVQSILLQPGDKIPRLAHKLSDKSEPSSYSIQFVYKNVRYAYSVSVLEERVVEEYLYYFPKGKQAKIFERSNDEISISDKLKKELETSKKVLKSNRLFLSCAANFSNVKEIEDAFLFFKEEIIVYRSDLNDWLSYSVKTLQDRGEIKSIFTEFIKTIQSGLYNIYFKNDKEKLGLNDFPAQSPQDIKSIIGTEKNVDIKLDYKKFIVDLSEESNGIKKLFEVLGPIIDILLTGRILIWDEIETSLHPNIVMQIIDLFKYSRQKEFAQLIFSTHDTSLLDLDLFRRDQIWFTELKPEIRSTDLYSLAELKRVRKDENIRKGYISGKYGAIPMLNDKISDVINEVQTNDR